MYDEELYNNILHHAWYKKNEEGGVEQRTR